MLDIKRLREICEKATPGSRKRLRKALRLACAMIVEQTGACPGGMYEWEGCLMEDCQNDDAGCWERYFLEKVRGEDG